MTNYNERLPIFVYGTLRPGGGLAHAHEGTLHNTLPASLNGAALYGKGYGFPYAVRAPENQRIVGDVLFVREEEYDQLIRTLDRIEGFVPGRSHNHYERTHVRINVHDDGDTSTLDAWVYLCRDQWITERMVRIVTGDWFNQDVAEELYDHLRRERLPTRKSSSAPSRP
jgi:gamma-glutamylcyclotransferase (GGCT)/AIG2-like uncharacterized protein YtfP